MNENTINALGYKQRPWDKLALDGGINGLPAFVQLCSHISRRNNRRGVVAAARRGMGGYVRGSLSCVDYNVHSQKQFAMVEQQLMDNRTAERQLTSNQFLNQKQSNRRLRNHRLSDHWRNRA